jgi:hypothetical protein
MLEEYVSPPSQKVIDNYNNFWKPILEDENGNINKDQLIKELSDFSFIMEQVPQVYSAICGLSKLMYPAQTIINELDARWIEKSYAYEDLCGMLEEEINVNSEIKDLLREYFDQPEDDNQIKE